MNFLKKKRLKASTSIVAGILLALATAGEASGQVLFTGETSGRGNGAVYFFGTVSSSDTTVSSNEYGDVVIGLSRSFDLVVGLGDMVADGRQSPYGTIGVVLGVPAKPMGFSLMVFPSGSVPIGNDNSSTVITNLAIVASRQLSDRFHKPTAYFGYLGTFGIGPTDRVLSAPRSLNQLPLGLFVGLSEKWGVTVEYDLGIVGSAGIALNRSFTLHP